MFQRVLLDFVLKTFGLGAENETRTRIRVGISRELYLHPRPLIGVSGVASCEPSFPTKKAAHLDCFSSLSGKRDSNPRKRGHFSREIYLHPQPLKGVSGVASCKSRVKRKKQPVWTAFLR